jgi:hypothetical protein
LRQMMRGLHSLPPSTEICTQSPMSKMDANSDTNPCLRAALNWCTNAAACRCAPSTSPFSSTTAAPTVYATLLGCSDEIGCTPSANANLHPVANFQSHSVIFQLCRTLSYDMVNGIFFEIRTTMYITALKMQQLQSLYAGGMFRLGFESGTLHLQGLITNLAKGAVCSSVVTWVMRARFFTRPHDSPSGVSQGHTRPH